MNRVLLKQCVAEFVGTFASAWAFWSYHYLLGRAVAGRRAGRFGVWEFLIKPE